jgi:GNAT superfamily N-acetyltransferase
MTLPTIHHESCTAAPLQAVVPRCDVRIRPAIPDDFAYIDALQKRHAKMLGFMHRQTIETYISRGDILIAEEVVSDQGEEAGTRHEAKGIEASTRHEAGGIGAGTRHEAGGSAEEAISDPPEAESRPLNAERCVPVSCHMPHASAKPVPVGYCMGRDRYFKRDDVGIIYQLVVEPGQRRSLVGAMLVQAMFERAAYGCRLFCCWCAQDLEANHFWESIGFVPLAFRTGSATRGKARIHIFWQKRIRRGDGDTPWWFPSQTTGGAIRADRLVIPIPIGTHWRDAKPLILPGAGTNTAEPAMLDGDDADGGGDGGGDIRSATDAKDAKGAEQPARRRRRKKDDATAAAVGAAGKAAAMKSVGMTGGLHFGPSAEEIAQQKQREAEAAQQKKALRDAKRKRAQRKNNPRYVAAARELRDRFIEEVQAHPELLDGLAGRGKYEVSRPRIAGRDAAVHTLTAPCLLDAA